MSVHLRAIEMKRVSLPCFPNVCLSKHAVVKKVHGQLF